MQDPICLITGATEGIGKATALELARKGFKVVLAARDPSKAEAVRREVDLLPGVPAADVIAADLASLDETRALAATPGSTSSSTTPASSSPRERRPGTVSTPSPRSTTSRTFC